VLDHWPLLYTEQELQAVSLGVGLALAAAAACMIAWIVFRGALGIVPLAPLASRLVARVAGGALCSVGIATFSLLFSLHRFAAAALEEIPGRAFLYWKGVALWAAAVLAVLFVLSAVPDFWRRRTSRAAKG